MLKLAYVYWKDVYNISEDESSRYIWLLYLAMMISRDSWQKKKGWSMD